jgi:hypothetical protein
MYTTEILTLLGWPVLIALSYFVAAWLIKKFESRES